MTTEVDEDKDDNFKEDKSSTIDPKVVGFEKQIAELRAKLELKELKRMELKAQVEALQSEMKALSYGSRKLEETIHKLELAHLSYIVPKLAKSKFY
ncbi:hypothetical protein SLEP1_g46921 [Rubroshorea leprosula]|uniref:Uncharacterized protein n=1 Tax=Rubroshorea leprosula TaxID=152421 RepID=A0AAV5LPK4_9ROSI|nr:hypothetical protein SLEP1_g46921 [Rubroshorea leprosula]